jgi:glycosyltransferase involved in cell wall biosynthesis
MERMRIAIVAPPWFAVPPTGYGGIELVVSYLADGLVERGHDVTLFAAGGSRTKARLVATFPEPPSHLLGDTLIEQHHALLAYERWHEFDIIHDHTLPGTLVGACLPVPVVHTLHGPVTDRLARLLPDLAERVHLVAISHHQRSTLPAGVRATVIHNGIDPAAFPFSDRPGDYLLFCGRINPEKGPVEAIEIARLAGKPLLMVVKINEQLEREYWEAEVKPRLRGLDVEVKQQPPTEEKLRAYRDALATLFPVQWPEPFGLVMIESMATGTPVIAFRNGSVPEVVEDGVTGYICESVEEAAEAVHRAASLDRKACRQRVERHFSAALNVLRHEQLYRSILAGDGRRAGMHALLRGAPPLEAAEGRRSAS